MEKQRCKTHVRVLHGFLKSSRENWRYSMYIECGVCPQDDCERKDFLFTPDKDGTPLLFPVPDAEIVFGRTIDKSECLGVITNIRFVGIRKEDLMDTDKNTVQTPVTELNELEDKRTYTVLEIAGLLRISKSKAYELCGQELFRIIRIGRSVRVSKASFDEWLDKKLND